MALTGACTFAGNWDEAKSSQMLTKWVLKNQQDLAYRGMKQRLDMAFFFFFFRRGMSWRSFLFKSPSHVRSVLFPSALQGHKFSSLVSAPAL